MQWYHRYIVLLWLVVAAGGVPVSSPCPVLPVYPNATKIDYVEQPGLRRETTYRVAGTAAQVLTFYKQYFQQHSRWVMNSERSTDFTMDYRPSWNEDPYSFGIVIQNETQGVVTYKAVLMIGRYSNPQGWCPGVRP